MTHKLRVLRDLTPDPEPGDAYEAFVSHNSKTGHSINVAIARTCRPTKACAEYCYALDGRLRFPAALAAQARNATFFEAADDATLKVEARRVGRTVLRRQDFIRMFGVGDLQPGSARFIGHLATLNDDLQVWVSTRKLDLADGLPRLPNLHVMMSCDATTTEANVRETQRLIDDRDGMFYAAWVRRGSRERVPSWVSVVFEEHHMSGRANWDPERRACPATIRGGAEHDGACARCRFCFDADKREAGPPLAQIRRKR